MIRKKSLIILSMLLVFSITGCSKSTSDDLSASSSISTNSSEQNSNEASEDTVSSNSIEENTEKDINKIKFQTYDDSVTLVNNSLGIPVLYYHSVNSSESNEVIISPEKLRSQLQYIKDQGYITLTIDQVNDYILNNVKIPEKSILITFDDGYMDNYTEAFPILKELNMTATIFCITSSLDGSYYMSHDAIKEMYDYGISIQSHTVNHLHLDTLSYDEQLEELTKSKAELESIIGNEVISIAFPFGDYNSDTVKAAKEAGYKLAFTTNQGLSNQKTSPLELNRIYISSAYDMDTFKSLLTKYEK